jgi:hypothetical protein
VAAKMTKAVQGRHEVLLLGGSTFFGGFGEVEDEMFAAIHTSCNCGDLGECIFSGRNLGRKCKWQNRFISLTRLGYDIAFWHYGYNKGVLGFITGIDFELESPDPFDGVNIRKLWNKAGNITRWSP